MRAEELRMRAASIEWGEARASILKVAETSDALAQTMAGHCRATDPTLDAGEKRVGVS